jgi:hypothetical protein
MVDPGPPIVRRNPSAAPPVAPTAAGGAIGPSQRPVHAGPIALESLATGMRALAAAPAVIVGGSLAVVLLQLPADLGQFALLDTAREVVQEVVRLVQESMDDPSAAASGTASISRRDDGTGAVCFGALLDLFVASPVLAGVLVAAAHAAQGTVAWRDLGAGFLRFPAVMLAMVILTVSGASLSMLAALVGGVAWAASLPPAEPGTAIELDASMLACCSVAGALLIVLPMLWGASRLWFAPIRAADLDRPPLAGHSCVAWSWRATKGCQLGLLGGTIVLFGLACALAAPLRMLALQAAPAGMHGWAGAAAWLVAAIAVLPVAVAVSGAAYAMIAQSHEPMDGVAITRTSNGTT